MSISEERLAEIRGLVERADSGDLVELVDRGDGAIVAFSRGRIGAKEILWLLNQRERLREFIREQGWEQLMPEQVPKDTDPAYTNYYKTAAAKGELFREIRRHD